VLSLRRRDGSRKLNAELVERYRRPLEATVGPAGRLISFSKSGYRERHPDRVPVFNANLALRGGRVWYGDLDLSVDELALVELARRVGQSVYLLRESDSRFEHEAHPLLGRAVYQVNQDGLCRFDHRFIVRDRDGVLRQRTPDPRARRRIAFTVGRPRLWRFWRHEFARSELMTQWGRERSTLLYLGERGTGRQGSPLLVLGYHRTAGRAPARGIEWTWYPSQKRHAPRPLLLVRLRWRHGRVHPYLTVHIQPGFTYALYAGINRNQA